MEIRSIKKKIVGTPKSFWEYYNRKKINLELNAIWFGFTLALGFWFLAVSLALLWIIGKGTGTYWLEVYIYVQGIMGVFLGGILAGRRSPGHGWLHGLWVGILLGMVGVIINLEMMPQVYTWAAIGRQMMVWSLWRLAGGYVGHDFKERFSRRKRQSYSQNTFLDKKSSNR